MARDDMAGQRGALCSAREQRVRVWASRKTCVRACSCRKSIFLEKRSTDGRVGSGKGVEQCSGKMEGWGDTYPSSSCAVGIVEDNAVADVETHACTAFFAPRRGFSKLVFNPFRKRIGLRSIFIAFRVTAQPPGSSYTTASNI